MQYSRLIILVAAMIAIGSCNKDEKGSLTLHFLGQAEGNPLEIFKTVNIDGESLQFRHISMIISDLKLLTPSGSEFLSDVELVDLSFDDHASSSEGFSIRIDQVPANTYSGISFGIGAPRAANEKSPSDFPSSNPLSKTGYYWEAWESYIFMKIEGRIDTIAPLDFETNFSYHTGTDNLYRILESGFPLSILDGQDTELSVVFNFDEVLKDVDIVSNPQNHNPEDTIQIYRIVNNLQSAITIFQ